MRPTMRERGSALVMTLLLSTVLVFLGATFLTVSMTGRAIASNEADAVRAFNVAEAGLAHALALLPGTSVDAVLGAGGVLIPNQPLGDGSYTVTLTNNVAPDFPIGTLPLDAGGATSDMDGIVVVTAVGNVRQASRRVQTIYASGGGVFDYAVWSDAKLTVSASGTTDSYDSSSGPYDPATAGSDGHVFSNTEITLSGSSMIEGDAQCAGATPADGSHVTGSATASDPAQSQPVLACPAGPYTPFVPPGPGVSYDPVTGKLTVGGGNNLTLSAPPTEYYFSEITLSGGSTLTFDNPSASVLSVYISGKFDLSGGGVVNGTGRPPLLGIWACGPGPEDFKLSGGSGAYFTVYAPNRKVTVSGSGDLWGAVIAGEFTSSGGSQVHYDLSLGSGNWTPVPFSWVELF